MPSILLPPYYPSSHPNSLIATRLFSLGTSVAFAPMTSRRMGHTTKIPFKWNISHTPTQLRLVLTLPAILFLPFLPYITVSIDVWTPWRVSHCLQAQTDIRTLSGTLSYNPSLLEIPNIPTSSFTSITNLSLSLNRNHEVGRGRLHSQG